MFARLIEDKNEHHSFQGIPFKMYSEDGEYMVKVINICDLLDNLYGDDWFRKSLDYKYTSNGVINWCEKNNC